MTVRPLQPSDIPTLNALAAASGFPYPATDDPMVEAVLVVVDESDKPLLAVGAKRLVELYLWCGKGLTPHENVAALRLLHDAMAEVLRTKGYDEGVETFLPPSVSGKFGRRLEKTFGWTRNWASWHRNF